MTWKEERIPRTLQKVPLDSYVDFRRSSTIDSFSSRRLQLNIWIGGSEISQLDKLKTKLIRNCSRFFHRLDLYVFADRFLRREPIDSRDYARIFQFVSRSWIRAWIRRGAQKRGTLLTWEGSTRGARGPRARLGRTTREWTLRRVALVNAVPERRLRIINSFTARIIVPLETLKTRNWNI